MITGESTWLHPIIERYRKIVKYVRNSSKFCVNEDSWFDLHQKYSKNLPNRYYQSNKSSLKYSISSSTPSSTRDVRNNINLNKLALQKVASDLKFSR